MNTRGETVPHYADSAPAWGRSLMIGLIILSTLFSSLPPELNWNHSARADLSEGSLIFKLQWTSLFLAAALVCYVNRSSAWAIFLKINPILIIIIIYCLASALWSPYPNVTLKRVIQLLGVVIIGIALQASQISLKQFIYYLFATLVGIQAASLLAIFLIPGISIEYTVAGGGWTGGAWRGILMQKNELGMLCALSIFFQIALISMSGQVRAPFATAMIFCMSLTELVMAKSTTSTLMMFLGIASYLFFKSRHIQSPYFFTRTSLIALSFVFSYLFLYYLIKSEIPKWEDIIGTFTGLLGKKADLTGRTDIWELIFQEIQQHWISGVGYGAFWLGIDSPSQFIITFLGWVPYQAHNGYLDIINEIGAIGFAFFLIFLIRYAFDLRKIFYIASNEASFTSALLLIILVSNFSESSIFRGVVFFSNLLIFSSIYTTTALARHQQQGQCSPA